MQLAIAVVNHFWDDLTSQLAGGAVVFWTGTPPENPDALLTLQTAIVILPLPTPAFAPARDGLALSALLPPVKAIADGTISWAQLLTADGVCLAILSVRSVDAADAEKADILLSPRCHVQEHGTVS